MIEAGLHSQITWGEGNWVFLDIGFSRDARSCGVLMGDGNPASAKFGEAKRLILARTKAAQAPLNLVIEAPLSVCSMPPETQKVDPSRKRVARHVTGTYGTGCSVMVAAIYLVRDLENGRLDYPVRLFEGFISYKDPSVPSDHERDVLLLREVVRDPDKFKDSLFSPEQLKQNSTDELLSAFRVAGYHFGIPPVIKRKHQKTRMISDEQPYGIREEALRRSSSH